MCSVFEKKKQQKKPQSYFDDPDGFLVLKIKPWASRNNLECMHVAKCSCQVHGDTIHTMYIQAYVYDIVILPYISCTFTLHFSVKACY